MQKETTSCCPAAATRLSVQVRMKERLLFFEEKII